MEEPVKKNYKFRIILYVLISVFGILYFASFTGYYENRISNQTRLTKEAIAQFENDISEGKPVDIKDYLEEKKDYQNIYSNLGYTISNAIDVALNDGVSYLFKILKALFS